MTASPNRRAAVLGTASSILSLGLARKAAWATEPAPIACWGDSLTFGTGASTIAKKYPNALAARFSPPRLVFNGGVGGDSSGEIAARMLGDEAHRGWIAVLWAGRNNYRSLDAVLADVAAMVAHLQSRHFVVLSVPNADVTEEYPGAEGYRAILALNAELGRRYRDRFLDIRADLISHGLAAMGLSGTPEDARDISLDVPPASLRADHVHLNDAGQAVVAEQVHDLILRQGW